jgi:SnoaL-like domain
VVAPYRRAKGPAEIAAWLAQSVPPEPRRMHYTMNSVITVEGAHAAARSNYLVMVEGATGPVPSVCGTYQDVLVKQSETWRFQRRELLHAFKGDMALHLTSPAGAGEGEGSKHRG